MSYIEKNLTSGEQILVDARPSKWSYVPVMVLWCITLVLFFMAIVVYIRAKFTEMVVTNKRILVKSGFISTRTDELRLDKCEGVNIDQSVMGTIFGYGTIIFSGIGTNRVYWYYVDNPKKIKNAIEDIIHSASNNI